MLRKPFGQLRNFSIIAMLVFWIFAVAVQAQVPATPQLGLAGISGNDVYVRSGPSSNHYPVLKLAAGARVTVVGERGAWYEIVPPAGAFSFISGDFVDSADGKTGVVNPQALSWAMASRFGRWAVSNSDRPVSGWANPPNPSTTSMMILEGVVT